MEQPKSFSVSPLEQTVLTTLGKLPADAIESLAAFLRKTLADRHYPSAQFFGSAEKKGPAK